MDAFAAESASVSASVSVSASASASAIAPQLPIEIVDLIISKLPYPTIYKLFLKGNSIATRLLLKEGKRIITLLENLIHPEAEYSPIGDDFDFTNLDLITKQIWNMLICVSLNADSNLHHQVVYDACAFISMECDIPDSYDNMCSGIWESIIMKYLESEYASYMEMLGGYGRWSDIYSSIKEFPVAHGLDTLAKQKYALSILIMTYLKCKDTIMNMYEDEYERIDTHEKYYDELRNLIATVSGYFDVIIISREFVKKTFYFMSE